MAYIKIDVPLKPAFNEKWLLINFSTMKPPYYAVIFTNTQTENLEGYDEMAQAMETLAKQQPGYLGMEHARNEIGITISYWKTLEAIKNWKANLDHLEAQQYGKTKWYKNYKVRICKVEQDYEFNKATN